MEQSQGLSICDALLTTSWMTRCIVEILMFILYLSVQYVIMVFSRFNVFTVRLIALIVTTLNLENTILRQSAAQNPLPILG